jgi:hypothetical protein
MGAMGSSPPNKRVFDRVRKKWLIATPEERVRQKILLHLTEELGYPSHAIVIEKKLSELPHLYGQKVPDRRLDILCFESVELRPLLLIECKSVSLQEKMLSQVMGYNAFIGAPLICLANEREFLLGWGCETRPLPFKGLPTYQTLCDETRPS